MNCTTSGCYNFKECLPPPNLSCSGPEFKVNEEFLQGLNSFASENILIPAQPVYLKDDFKSVFHFTDCNELLWEVKPGDLTANSLTVTILCESPVAPAPSQSTLYRTDKCKIIMQLDNPSAAHTYSAIVSFSNLEVPASGGGNAFTVLAHFKDETSQILNCSTTCLQLKPCVTPCLSQNYGTPAYKTSFEDNGLPAGSSSDLAPMSACYQIGYLQLPYMTVSECDFSYAGTAHNTGSSNPAFLFFNYPDAATGPVKLWGIDQINVQPHTNYRFSAFYKILFVPAPYTLSLLIDNTSQVSTNSLTAPSGVWQEWTGIWNSGESTTVNLRVNMTGISSPGEGQNNMVCLDDISLTPFTDVPCDPCTRLITVGEETFDGVNPTGYTVSGVSSPSLAVSSANLSVYSHTSPGTGKFLQLASANPVPWSVAKVFSGIVPNTKYQFSCWVSKFVDQNFSPSHSGSVNFNGTASSFSLAGKPHYQWHKVTSDWYSGVTSGTVSIEIKFNTYEGTIAVDDIKLEKHIPCEIADPDTIPDIPYHNTCVEQLLAVANSNAHASYDAYIKSEKQKFRNAYMKKCLGALENLKMVYTDREHHTTLYYYDQAGSLIKTVPPAGVVLVKNQTAFDSIRADRASGKQTFFTKHTLQTKYEYNSLGQLLRQATPDNDLTNKWTLNGTSTLPAGSNIYGMAFSNGDNGFVVGDDGAGVGIIYTTSDGGAHWSPVSRVGVGNLKDIQFVGTRGYAISDAGYLVKTTDGGSNWNILPTGTAEKLNDLYFSSATDGIIIGNNGIILKTSNGGASWTRSVVPALNPSGVDYNDMHFSDADNGFIAGDKATVLKTIDGGATWSNLPPVVVGGSPSALLKFNAIHFDAINNIVYVAGVNASSSPVTGFIAKATIDAVPNTTWTYPSSLPSISGVEFKSIFAVNATTVFAAGTRDRLYQSTDGGYTFVSLSIGSLTPSNTEITELSFPDAANPSQGYAAAKNGQFIKSNISGTTWAASGIVIGTQTNVSPLNGLYFEPSAPATGYAAGNGGTIIKTTNGGSSWSSLTNVVLPKLKATCSVPDTTVSYAVGADEAIYKTTNGVVWEPIHGGAANQLNGVAFENTTKGFAVGENATVLKINSGSVTTITSASGSPALNAVVNTPDGNYVAVGDAGKIARGTFSSPSWTFSTTTVTPAPDLNSVCMVDNNNGYACGNNGAVIKTINGGSTWVDSKGIALDATQNPPVPVTITANLHKIYFKDILIGYAMGDAGTILKTIDGGAHWNKQPGITGENFYAAAFTGDGHAFISGTGTPKLAVLNDESYDYSSRFFYDRLGRLVVSQNTKQFKKTPKAYSYTVYDALGRISQVGEIATGTDIASLANTHGVIAENAANTIYTGWLAAGAKTEITTTTYDSPASIFISGFTQKNLRTRVSSISIDELGDNTYDHATYFTYDIHGNVKELIQDNPSLASVTPSQQYKRTSYSYDLVSGNVNQVDYQSGQPDQFHHKYLYDADNRLTNVYTSKDNQIWDQDAKYFYYLHGPLARTELGDQKVQGIDYAYTIQNWVKGCNSNLLQTANDIGKDGDPSTNNINKFVTRDAYSYSLEYFNGDYTSINNSTTPQLNRFLASVTGSDLNNARKDLYNGNISSMVTTLTNPTNGQAMYNGMAYQYDQLNRLKEAAGFSNLNVGTNIWQSGSTYNGRYYQNFSYYPNGNIETALVKNDAGQIIDNQTYHYPTVNEKKTSNRLYAITDAATQTGGYDLQNQAAFDNSNVHNNNYDYTEIGELKKDVSDDIAEIKRKVDGNITEVIRTSGSTKENIKFNYDASGNRIAKHNYSSANVWIESQYYVRDASGNIMSTYQQTANSFNQTEKHIYGSALIGIEATQTDMLNPPANTNLYTHTLGKKNFTGANHLGNDLVIFTDRRIAHDDNNNGITDYYTADILSSKDYGPFGEYLTNRVFTPNAYPNSFNGKRDDEELFGWHNYGFRNYIKGRRGFDRMDPITKEYPWYTPYQFAGNNPIQFIDLDGLEPKSPEKLQTGAALGVVKADEVKKVTGAKAACNIGVQTSTKEFTGKDIFAGKNAQGITEGLAKGEFSGFEKLTTIDVAKGSAGDQSNNLAALQDLANAGYLVIGAAKTAGGDYHAVSFVPGVMEKKPEGSSEKSGTFSIGKTPQVLDTGREGNFKSTPLSNVSGRTTIENMDFYIYNPEKKTEYKEVINKSETAKK